MVSESEVSIQKSQSSFWVGVYQIACLNPQRLSLISGTAEFLIEMTLGRSIPFLITKPVVAAHTCNDILASRVVVGEISRLHLLRKPPAMLGVKVTILRYIGGDPQ